MRHDTTITRLLDAARDAAEAEINAQYAMAVATTAPDYDTDGSDADKLGADAEALYDAAREAGEEAKHRAAETAVGTGAPAEWEARDNHAAIERARDVLRRSKALVKLADEIAG